MLIEVRAITIFGNVLEAGSHGNKSRMFAGVLSRVVVVAFNGAHR